MTVTASAVKELREITGAGMMECKKALVETNGDVEAAKDFLRKKGQAKALKKSARETPEGGIGIYISDDKRTAGIVRVACETDFVARNDKFKSFVEQLAQQVAVVGDKDVLAQSLEDGEGTVEDLVTKQVGELGENIKFLEARKLAVSSGVIGSYVHSNGKIGVLTELSAGSSSDELEALAKDVSMHIAASQAEAIQESDLPKELVEKERNVLISQAKESGKPDNIIEKMVEGRVKKFVKEICIVSQPFVKNPEKTVEELINETGSKLGETVSLTNYAKFQF